jgi:predicted ATP-grasp superfamily ATP-dependent carboligase
VVQAETLGALAVIRSLGRAGYYVHACSTRDDALGLMSRFAAESVVCPDYKSASFLGWLRGYLQAHAISAIVPSESLLLAMRPCFDEFSHLLSGCQEEKALYAGLSKFDLFSTLMKTSSAGNHLPPTLLIEDTSTLPGMSDLRRLPLPLYLKVDGSYARQGESGRVFKAESHEDAQALLRTLAPRFKRAVVQGFIPGRGVGAFFLLHRGELLAEFMHVRLHEVPYTGGASSLRASWRHEAIRNDALTKLRCIQWEGVAMMEYRWDVGSDEFHLLEMNGRFWGSLHLPLWAGVDFPRLLLDAFYGFAPGATLAYPLGVRCRHTFPGELQYLWSRIKDSRLALGPKFWSVLEFLLLGANPKVHSDLFFPGDRSLYFRSIVGTLRFIQEFIGRGERGGKDQKALQQV